MLLRVSGALCSLVAVGLAHAVEAQAGAPERASAASVCAAAAAAYAAFFAGVPAPARIQLKPPPPVPPGRRASPEAWLGDRPPKALLDRLAEAGRSSAAECVAVRRVARDRKDEFVTEKTTIALLRFRPPRMSPSLFQIGMPILNVSGDAALFLVTRSRTDGFAGARQFLYLRRQGGEWRVAGAGSDPVL